MNDSWIWAILLQLIMLGLNAYFACAEIAVISVNENHINKLIEEGDKRAVKLKKISEVPTKFLSTIQIAITLSGFLGSAYATDNFAASLTGLFAAVGLTLPRSIAVFIITVLLSYITLVCGELVPKRLAQAKSEQIALSMANPLSVVAKIFTPFIWLLTVSTNGVLRLLHVDPNQQDDDVSEEEIRMMVDAGSEKGVIEASEQELIHNVFAFNDISVEEICTHRTDVSVLWKEDPVEEWEKTVHESRHSYFPVCGESIDDVLGILSAKDYFRLSREGVSQAEILKKSIRPASFVPNTIKADVLFRNMKKSGNYFAVVLDEYGGVDGIITLRDLIEQLVGDLNEEEDGIPVEDIVQLTDNSWKIQGLTSLDDVQEALGVPLPVDEYDTFSGYIFGILGQIPEDNSQFALDAGPLHITVESVKEHLVGEALVQQAGIDGLGNVLGIPGPFGDGKAGGVPLAGDVEHPAEDGHCLGSGEAAVRGHGGGTAALQNAVFIGLLQGGFRPVAFHIGEILKGSLRSGGHPQDHGRGQDQGQQFFHGLFHLSFLPCWSHFQACPEGIWKPLPLVYWIF